MYFLSRKSNKKTVISGLIIGCLMLTIGIGVYFLGTNKSEPVSIKAAPSSKIEILEPKPNSTLSDITLIQASAKLSSNIQNLTAVYKLDDNPAKKMEIERLDEENILIKDEINTKEYESREYNLIIYLYGEYMNINQLIGQNSFNIRIAN